MEHETTNIGLDALSSSSQLTPVYDYWQSIRRDNSIPALTDLDMMELPLKVVPWCSIVDVSTDPLDFIVRFWGTERVRLHRADHTGQSISMLHHQAVREKAKSEYSAVADSGQPMLLQTVVSASPDTGKRPTTYKILHLPFGENGNVSSILTVPSFGANLKLVYDWFNTEVPIAVLTNDKLK